MASNPLVDQGVLNRLRGSLLWADFPELNVTASYLGEDAIRVAQEGDATAYLRTLTGAARSPEPYMLVLVTANLLKTQFLSDAYKSQQESDTFLGDGTLRLDTKQLSPYQFTNCSIAGVDELQSNGRVVGYNVRIRGVYPINGDLFDLAD